LLKEQYLLDSMERKEIIKNFLEKGYQIDFASLEFFFKNQDKIDQFFGKIENKQPPSIITLNFLRSFFKKPNIETLKTFDLENERNSVQQFVKYFTNRYEKLREFLLNNVNLTNLISINKITNQTKNFSLIGMVREKDEENKCITIEDTTGELIIYFDKVAEFFHEIVSDDVLGVVCDKNDKIIAKHIVWPEVSLRRSINTTKEDVYCLFISDFHFDEENFNKEAYEKFLKWVNNVKYDKFYIFVLGDVSPQKDIIVNFFDKLPNNSFKIFVQGEIDPDIDVGDVTIRRPSLLKVEDNLMFLVCHGDELSKYKNIWKGCPPDKLMVNLLKKRQLDPLFNKQIYKEDQILETVPDIFVSGHFHEPILLNYKGTTVLSTGSFTSRPIFWLTNLRARETIKVDFT